MGGRSLTGGCCAGRKASSAVCCGVVLVLVSPGLDPAYSTAVAAQVAVSTRCSQAFLPLPDPVCTPDQENSNVTYDTIDQTICVPWWARTSRLVTCLVAVNVWCPSMFGLLVVPASMLFRPFETHPSAFT